MDALFTRHRLLLSALACLLCLSACTSHSTSHRSRRHSAADAGPEAGSRVDCHGYRNQTACKADANCRWLQASCHGQVIAQACFGLSEEPTPPSCGPLDAGTDVGDVSSAPNPAHCHGISDPATCDGKLRCTWRSWTCRGRLLSEGCFGVDENPQPPDCFPYDAGPPHDAGAPYDAMDSDVVEAGGDVATGADASSDPTDASDVASSRPDASADAGKPPCTSYDQSHCPSARCRMSWKGKCLDQKPASAVELNHSTCLPRQSCQHDSDCPPAYICEDVWEACPPGSTCLICSSSRPRCVPQP